MIKKDLKDFFDGLRELKAKYVSNNSLVLSILKKFWPKPNMG
jgi:hypothetical protein